MNTAEPINGYILLKQVDEQEQMYGQIALPDLGRERPEVGIVVQTSPTYNFNTDKEIPSKLEVGQKVMLPKLGAIRITLGNEDYFLAKESDIYSKIID